MTKKHLIHFVAFSAITATSCQAALTWRGTNNTFFQESNWQENSGGAPAAGTVDPNTNISASTAPDNLILFDNSLGGTSSNGVGGNVDLGVGNSLQIGGALILKTTATFGLRGSTAIAGSTANVYLLGAASANFQFGREIDFILSGASTLTLRGGNDSLPNSSTVDLLDLFGSQVVFTAEDVAAFTSEHLSKFSVNGAPAVIGTNLSVVSNGGSGSIVTAIPEPSSTALIGLAGLALMLRRRK
ncbi:PEP-CTERM sorting domain-containing protein [bacterium]|nr:PEP-CTERM sorting domain-containing protein [Akkermansiaceae bacterium]MDB4257757.1 PEP-CTERM sorting domain-containing protein [bacterium]MDA8875895.1 PEP-CTERM sorting domain-containing protein [Akkermansiaceae bacterium]MDB0055930.1 PEP-CTERM sorting domain-containing protein [Akkermansiaceae bacterium]MDB4142254.1 PEP-CTERM sorting domain-containing protein [Akkermansiaceae bacterium]